MPEKLECTTFCMIFGTLLLFGLGKLALLFHFRFSVVLFDFPGISSCDATRCTCQVIVFESSWYFVIGLFYRDDSLTS